ncbi:ribosomal protein S5 domain 2-type protein [Dissophora ornata]|nr:ribosomal protein S5 domain 2-type protein [Dissophora ornata]
MDLPSALEEEALAIVSIYGPASFYALSGSEKQATAQTPSEATPVYALKVSLEEPVFDFDGATDNRLESTTGTSGINTAASRNTKEFELRIYFPKGYPESNTSAPVHEIVSIYYGTLRLTDAMIQEIDQGLEQCFVPGEVVVFSWVEWLREYLEGLENRLENEGVDRDVEADHSGDEVEDELDVAEDEGDEAHVLEGQKTASDYFAAEDFSQDLDRSAAFNSSLASLSLHHSPVTLLSDNNRPRIPRVSGAPVFDIRSGPPIVDRKSVFVAHLAPVTQPGQVPWMIQQLKQENKKVVKATHNIMAFRIESENGTISQDNDDDGEAAAGSRLLHLMSILDVKNVVVVVSRWYGGIPLSADRFKHINNAARQLLDECGYIKQAVSVESASSANSKKKGKSKKAGKR